MSTKKYVSLEKLGLYDEKIKKVITDSDATTLAAAKEYANSLAGNYEAAGSIATAKTELEGKITTAQTAADAAAQAAATAQGEVDALETLVGTLPTGTDATSVVEYVTKRTEGIATDAALSELQSAVDTVEADVATIKGDYLKAADKTALNDAIAAEKTRAEGIEGGLETRLAAVEADHLKGADKTALQGAIDGVAEDVAAIEADYLKAADKTELQGKIDAKAAQTALDAEVDRATKAEAGLQTQINTIMNNPDTDKVVDSINEFTAWVSEHGTLADGMRTDIDKNKEDIAAEVKRAGEAEAALAGRLDILEDIDHDAYVAADTALKTELTGEIAKKADTTALNSAVEALDGDIADLQAADTALSGRLDAVEAKFTGDDSVSDMIADAKAEVLEELNTAIEGAKTDASNKDAVVLAEAQKASTAVQTALDTHTNNGDIHVTTADKTKWNAALQASDVATGTSNGTISVKGTDVAVYGLGSAAYAATTAFDVAGAASAAETAAKTYTDEAVAKFVECSEEEINALFAQAQA